ncbi:hypothetical protein IMSAGC016_00298 [Muribaculaceae bacterium]|nr:hypothetical protein IMSAGC016_00298 [Muribaculaceae bacterium]
MNLLKSQCPIPYPMTEVMILTEQAVNVGIRSGNPKNVNQNRQDNKRRELLIAIYLPTQLLQQVKVTVTEAMRPARVWSLAR